MLCVMHVNDGNETRAERFVNGLLGDKDAGRCFHLTRLRNKKYGGKWRIVREALLPGYVFVVTDEPEQLYRELRKAPGCGLLGDSGGGVATLGRREADFMKKISGSGSRVGEIPLSRIAVGEDGNIAVLSGPLLSVGDRVRKIDLHRRTAEVEAELMGQKRRLYLGVEIKEAGGAEDVVYGPDGAGRGRSGKEACRGNAP